MTKTKKAIPKSLMKVFNVEQGTDAWFECRRGIPTASNFSTVLASGVDGGESVGRSKYMQRLAVEIITEELSPEGFKSAAMEKGNALEHEARSSYASRKNAEVQQVGFVRNFEGLKLCGASPDGLIGFDGGLEIKIATEAHILIPMLKKPILPPAHRAQVQGNIFVCERDWWDLTIYMHRAMPAVDVRVYRDETYLKMLSGEIEKFNWELKKLVEQLRNMGAAG